MDEGLVQRTGQRLGQRIQRPRFGANSVLTSRHRSLRVDNAHGRPSLTERVAAQAFSTYGSRTALRASGNGWWVEALQLGLYVSAAAMTRLASLA